MTSRTLYCLSWKRRRCDSRRSHSRVSFAKICVFSNLYPVLESLEPSRFRLFSSIPIYPPERPVTTLENGLKTVAANPLGAPAGPLEGYIALASRLGPLARVPQFGMSFERIEKFSSTNFDLVETVVSRNTTLQSLSNTSSPKPSFLFWDKVYHKLNTDEERKWVLRALTASMTFMSAELKKSSTLR